MENNYTNTYPQEPVPAAPAAKRRSCLIPVLVTLAIIVAVSVGGVIAVASYFSPESVAERYVKAGILYDYETLNELAAYDIYSWLLLDRDPDAFFANQSYLKDADIDSFEDLSEVYGNNADDRLYNNYGDYKLKINAVRVKDISLYRLQEAVEDELEYVNRSALFDTGYFTAAKEVTVRVKLTGDEETMHHTVTVYVVRVGLFWKVIYPQPPRVDS